MDLTGLDINQINDKIKEVLTDIEQTRQQVNNFAKAAVANGVGEDTITFIASLSAAAASGGKDPAAIMACIRGVIQINNDLTAAANAVKAQTPA